MVIMKFIIPSEEIDFDYQYASKVSEHFMKY